MTAAARKLARLECQLARHDADAHDIDPAELAKFLTVVDRVVVYRDETLTGAERAAAVIRELERHGIHLTPDELARAAPQYVPFIHDTYRWATAATP
jgi:hypothetical protein